ncbi:MAG: hypothetical protein WKH64_03805 [Chloroflexia bacterium]
MPPHGGFAVGAERLLARLVAPRTYERSPYSRATPDVSPREAERPGPPGCFIAR